MTATVTPTQQDVFTALRAFILGLITCEVVQGLGNGVPMPLGQFIAITALFQNRLSTNVDTYNDPVTVLGTKKSQQAVKYTIQIDCYGPLSGDWAAILSTMLRDEYACIALAPNVQPLSADDPKMMPLIDGEFQYEQRWMVTAELQYNPVTSVSQDFAAALKVGLVNIDATYKP
jgi:hypothetical protein